MRKNRTLFVLGALLAACALAGCRGEGGIKRYLPGFMKRKPAVVPTEETFRAAAEKYFIAKGFEKTADGSYRVVEGETLVTHALEWDPVRINEYQHRRYRWQGIARRKIITRIEDKDVIKESPFIMYWNTSENRWEHLFGADIPQPGE